MLNSLLRKKKSTIMTMWPFKWRLLSIFLWFLSSIVCVYFAASWVRIFWGDSHPNYLFFCLVGIVLVLAVFKAWRDCSLSFTLGFQHRRFHFILGWSSLARCRTVKVSCLLVWCVILQINGQKLNCNLVASTVLYVLTTQMELSLKPAPHINFNCERRLCSRVGHFQQFIELSRR